MASRASLLTLPLTALLFACPSNPAEKAEKVKIGKVTKAEKPKEAEAPPAKPGPEGTTPVAIDSSKSKIVWVGTSPTTRHDGGFKKFSGTIHLDAKNIEKSRVDVAIDVDSIYSDDGKLTDHLKNGDFFDVPKHPGATFTTTKITKAGEGYKLAGTLELRGFKGEIEFPAKITVTDAAVKATAEFSFNRQPFGIKYKGDADDLVRDEVLVKLDITAPRK